jgi:hypothetical protein
MRNVYLVARSGPGAGAGSQALLKTIDLAYIDNENSIADIIRC